MLIICCGMPRAASTWQYRVASSLLKGSPHVDARWVASYDEFQTQGWASRADAQTVLLKTHDYDDRFGDMLRGGRARALHSIRDVRDVVISHAEAFGGTLIEKIEQLLPDILRSSDRWRAEPGVLTGRYEDMVADPRPWIRRFAAALGVECGDECAAQIDAACGIAGARAISGRLAASGLSASEYDARTLLHPGHVRDGRAGRWSGVLGADVLRRIDRIAGGWLRRNGYEGYDVAPAPPADAAIS